MSHCIELIPNPSRSPLYENIKQLLLQQISQAKFTKTWLMNAARRSLNSIANLPASSSSSSSPSSSPSSSFFSSVFPAFLYSRRWETWALMDDSIWAMLSFITVRFIDWLFAFERLTLSTPQSTQTPPFRLHYDIYSRHYFFIYSISELRKSLPFPVFPAKYPSQICTTIVRKEPDPTSILQIKEQCKSNLSYFLTWNRSLLDLTSFLQKKH